MQQIGFKVGSSFAVPLTYTPTPGLAPAALQGVAITSQVRTKEGKKLADLTPSVTDDTHFTLTATGGTSGWPGNVDAVWDIKMSHADYGTFYTETVEVRLEAPVTQ